MGNEIQRQDAQKSAVAVLAPRMNLSLESLGKLERPQIFFPCDPLISKYGVVGALVVDSRPEARSVSYIDSEWMGVKFEGPSIDSAVDRDPERIPHFYRTEMGFSLLRYFILPDNVGNFFRRESFLGDPMIEKCCRDRTVRTEFDELPASPRHIPVLYAEPIVDLMIKDLNVAYSYLGLHSSKTHANNHRAFISFHPWHAFNSVMEEAASAQLAALGNFDQFLSRFDTDAQLHQFQLPK